MGNQSAVVERWEKFIANISERHGDIIEAAAEGVAGMMEEERSDPIPLYNALKAIELRLIGLRGKLEDTFSGKVSGKLSGKTYDLAHRRLREATLSLEHDWDRFEARTVGDFFRLMAPLVEEAARKEVLCSQCGAPLELDPITRARTHQCQYCEALNQVVPHEIVAMYYATAPDRLAMEATLEQRIAIERFRDDVENKKVPENRKRWEQMERRYWEAYVAERDKLDPLPDAERTEYIESRLRVWRQGSDYS